MAYVVFNLLAAAALIGIDQAIKLWATNVLQPIGAMPLIPHVVELRFVLNPGMAFSLLSGKQLFLIIATSIALILVAYGLFFRSRGRYLQQAALLLILAGGIGNLIDRVLNGEVVDYINLLFMQFAVFNFADICVCVGVGLWVLVIFLEELHAENGQSPKEQCAMEQREFVVEQETAGQRIDRFLSGEDTGLSRSALQALVADGHVLCNGRLVAKSLKLKAGDTIVLEIPDAKPIEAVPQDIPLEIVYEDEHLLVVNKPKGMVVHPAPGNPDGTLVNALLWHCKGSLSGIGGEIRPGIVHRIDKDTSGLLVVAKDDATHIGLSQQMAVHSVERAYRTIVYGGFAQDEGFVESNLGRSKTDRKKMAVYPASEPHTKYAYTGYQVLERLNNFTMLECRLKTGRTHQIRVHMASIQHPVAGDPVYGPHNCITSLHGQCLHAKTLGFVHPITGEHLRFDSELPEYFTRFLATLRRGTV